MCPRCGYCPHCGRGGWARPYYPTQPFYTSPWYIQNTYTAPIDYTLQLQSMKLGTEERSNA